MSHQSLTLTRTSLDVNSLRCWTFWKLGTDLAGQIAVEGLQTGG